MNILSETSIKLEILTRGIEFSERAIKKAEDSGAKRQNGVYNLPVGVTYSRPQELFIEGLDGYITVVSCVSPVIGRRPILIDIDHDGELIAIIDDMMAENVTIRFVKEPVYYRELIEGGEVVSKYVSACGYDELNILPWRGCAISKGCKFCGINAVTLKEKRSGLTAFELSKNPERWDGCKVEYLKKLNAALKIAVKDECYSEHAHVIMISGNLTNNFLDFQAEIYSEIARNIKYEIGSRSTEGIVAVLTPPRNIAKLMEMKESGIDIVVFNLEVGNEPWFTKYCPGKAVLGRDFFINKLLEAVSIFGKGNVWSNFVLGLEPVEKLLDVCRDFAKNGIVCGANILHMDKGNQLDCDVPDKKDVMKFYCGLAAIYREFNLKPYYCSKALRTSLINEVYDGRISGEVIHEGR